MLEYEPVNTEPPFIPGGEIYETHRPAEWIAITDSLYSDVLNWMHLEGYHPSIVGLSDGMLWIHIETEWRKT